MPNFKISPVVLLVVTVLLAILAVGGAYLLLRSRNQFVPQKSAAADRELECVLSFTVESIVTPTVTPIPGCDTVCTVNGDCPTDLTCSSGKCRKAECTGDADCVCATPTSTATATPTGSVTATVTTTGEPNNCNGTCGSNYNCRGNLFCASSGYCRNPECPDEIDCVCGTTTVTSTPRLTSTVTPTRGPTPTTAVLEEAGVMDETWTISIAGIVLLGLGGLLMLAL